MSKKAILLKAKEVIRSILKQDKGFKVQNQNNALVIKKQCPVSRETKKIKN